MFLKTFDSENIDAWFTDQNCKPVEIEGKIIITLVINQSKWHAIQFNQETDFYLLLKICVKILVKLQVKA